MPRQGLYWEPCFQPTGVVMRIIADCHEPAEILNLLRTADGVDGSAVEIEAGSLDVGDYLIGLGAAVGRKAGGDFVASLLDGRMAEQAAKLRATYEKVVWIIEGDPYDSHIALEPRVITGAISHLAVVEGATVLRTQSLQETADLLLSMGQAAAGRVHVHGKSGRLFRHGVKRDSNSMVNGATSAVRLHGRLSGHVSIRREARRDRKGSGSPSSHSSMSI